MKKIVALVLSLVMVLGLATTAFGAAPANYYAANDLTTATGDAVANTYTLEAYTTGAATAKTFDQVALWATAKLTGAKTLVGAYTVATSAESADIAFVDGTVITYLSTAKTYTADVTAVATVDVADAEKCGEMFTALDQAVYADAAGNFYVESKNGTVYNAGGKAVKLAAATKAYVAAGDALEALTPAKGNVYIVTHAYDWDLKTVGSDVTVTRVFCTECKGEFAFIEGTVAEAIAKFGAGNYVPVAGYNDLYASVVPAGAAVAPEAGDKVESAETFDAGIAMYVGMSVMAAAGSAVVLKKKD